MYTSILYHISYNIISFLSPDISKLKVWSSWVIRSKRKHPFPVSISDLVESLDGILSSLLEDNIQVWAMKSQSEHRHVHTLLDKIDAASDQPVPTRLRVCTSLKSPTLYIFTSGTTGGSFVYSSDPLTLIIHI